MTCRNGGGKTADSNETAVTEPGRYGVISGHASPRGAFGSYAIKL
jgi:hypothetical protein